MATSARSLPDLLELLVSDASSSPFAFGVTINACPTTGTETIDLTLCELPPSPDPLQPLVGMVAPDGWDAFGLVSGATILESSQGTSLRDLSVWIGVIADRSGQLWASMREGDGLPVRLPSGGEGPLLDLCKRVLGIDSSPACQHTVRAALCALWIDEIRELLVARTNRSREPLWDELAVLHPANQLLPESLASLSHRSEQAARDLTWAELHRRCSNGSLKVPRLSPDDCRWFDAGSFSRWIVRSVPPLGEMYLDVLPQINQDTGRRLLEHVAELVSGGGDFGQGCGGAGAE